MTPRTRVYIAGPISKGVLLNNIKQAEEAFFRLLRAGFAPFCPHWSAYSTGPFADPHGRTVAYATAEGGGGCGHEDWLGVDLAWVAVTDAILRLPGESKGADMECEEARRLGIPIYLDVEHLISQPPPSGGDPEYLRILDQMRRLHIKKAADYGSATDSFANIRNGESIGIPAWKAAYLRSKDKAVRIDNYCLRGTLENETVEDSFLDNAAYNLIALRMFREAKVNEQHAA